MVNHILEIPRLVVFGVKCFNWNSTKFISLNNPAWNKYIDIEVVIYFPCLLKHPVYRGLCLVACRSAYSEYEAAESNASH